MRSAHAATLHKCRRGAAPHYLTLRGAGQAGARRPTWCWSLRRGRGYGKELGPRARCRGAAFGAGARSARVRLAVFGGLGHCLGYAAASRALTLPFTACLQFCATGDWHSARHALVHAPRSRSFAAVASAAPLRLSSSGYRSRCHRGAQEERISGPATASASAAEARRRRTTSRKRRRRRGAAAGSGGQRRRQRPRR